MWCTVLFNRNWVGLYCKINVRTDWLYSKELGFHGVCVYDSAFSCKTDVYASDKEMRKEDRWNGLILKCMKTRMSGSRNVSCCRPPPSTPTCCVCVCLYVVK